MSDKDAPNTEDDSEDKRDPNLEMPEGIAPPPMPRPDLHDIVEEGPTYGAQEEDTGKKRKKKKKSKDSEKKSKHPLDSVAMPGQGPKQTGKGKGCCGCLAGFLGIILVLFLILFLVVRSIGPARHLMDDYVVVSKMDSPSVVISEAPDVATYYIGKEIVYEAAETKVPIAIAGQKVSVSGDFYEQVTITGTKVIGTAKARFAKDLEVWAAEFLDEGITLKGELKGRVMQNAITE